MSGLVDLVTALADTSKLAEVKVALVASAVRAAVAALPVGSDPSFKSANASHQLGLAVIKDPDTYVAQAWLIIACSDDPLATADMTDDLVAAAVAAAWPAMAGITG